MRTRVGHGLGINCLRRLNPNAFELKFHRHSWGAGGDACRGLDRRRTLGPLRAGPFAPKITARDGGFGWQRVALCAAAKQVTSSPKGSQSPKRIPQDRRGLESDAACERRLNSILAEEPPKLSAPT